MPPGSLGALALVVLCGCSTSPGGLDAGGDAATDLAASDGAAATWWRPGSAPLPWQWELGHEISTSSANDVARGQKSYSGGSAADPAVYDIDGFDNSAAEVTALHGLGAKVICYIEVGALESYRPDAAKFSAAVQGKSVPNYPDEKYLNINDAGVLALIKARVALCAQKGFDGVEPDIDDSYTDDTGFSISEGDNVAYLVALSDYAHSLGLAWGLKNGGDGGTPARFIGDILPHVDFAVVEEPFYLKTIDYFEPAFYNAGKALFVAEYTGNTASATSFCPQAIAAHTNAALFNVNLDASSRVSCQ